MKFTDKLKDAVEKKEAYRIIQDPTDNLWWLVNDLDIKIHSAIQPWMLHEQLNKYLELDKIAQQFK